MDQFMEEQEKYAQVQVDTLIAEHQETLTKMTLIHERRLNDLKLELEASESRFQQQKATWYEQYQELRNDHDLLSLAYEGTKNERDQLQQKMTDLMETITHTSPEKDRDHRSLHKRCQEKQACLERKLHSLEHQPNNGNTTWTNVAEQHKNELEILYHQYQQQLNIKDNELEEYASRVQTLTMEQQKALASCRIELGDRITSLENQVDSYETVIHSNDQALAKLETQVCNLKQQNQKDQQIIHTLIEEKTVLQDQLDRWILYANSQQNQSIDSHVD